MNFDEAQSQLRKLGFIVTESDSERCVFDIFWPDSSICLGILTKVLEEKSTVEEQVTYALGEYIKACVTE